MGKKQPQGVATPWESPGRGIRAFEARMLHTHENFHNAPPTERRGLFGCSLPANYRHGRLCVVVILFSPPTDGSAYRGDPVERGKINWSLSNRRGSGLSLSLAPSGRGLPQSGWGRARENRFGKVKFAKIISLACSFRHASRATSLPEGGISFAEIVCLSHRQTPI